jgi:YtkA-like
LGPILIAACVATLAAIGCRRVSDTVKDISVREKIDPQPVRVGNATIAIQLADASARPVTHARISVEGDMSHPGMSPVFGTATETSPGVYTAHLDFNMGGDWVVLSHIVLPDGRKMERQIDVSGVESK